MTFRTEADILAYERVPVGERLLLRNVLDLLQDSAARHANRVAIRSLAGTGPNDPVRDITYAKLLKRTIQTANVLGGQAARAKFHYEALKKLEFVAVVDLFHNPTTMALADVVLPAATFPEKDSIRSWWAPLSIIRKRVQVGQCKSDWEINFELAKRFNPEGMKRWATLEDLFDERLAPSGMRFREIEQIGGWKMPDEGASKPYRRHERGLLLWDTGYPDALADQQLGGVVMLLVGGASYCLGGLWLLGTLLRRGTA